jgi:DNA-binding transcriptional MerR regulator
LRIGELAAASGSTTKTLRFYEDNGLLPPPNRAPNGYRDYTEDAVHRLDFIRRGRAAGLTLAQIHDIIELRDTGTAPCRHVAELLDQRLAALDAQIADLRTLRESVAHLRHDAAHADPAECHPDDVCRYL